MKRVVIFCLSALWLWTAERICLLPSAAAWYKKKKRSFVCTERW